MTNTGFTFQHEPRQKLLRINLSGHWDQDTLSRFEVAMAGSLRAAAVAGPVRLLIDARRHGVQSQATAAALQRLAATGRDAVLRTAVVVESAVHKLQANRINAEAHHRVFESESHATNWLLAD